jgi:hypothetical protein
MGTDLKFPGHATVVGCVEVDGLVAADGIGHRHYAIETRELRLAVESASVAR